MAEGKKKLLIMCFGSRGDTQPFLALSAHLQQAGYSILVTCNEEQVDFFAGVGVKALGSHFNMTEFLRDDPRMKRAMSTGRTDDLNMGCVKKVLATYEESLDKIWSAILDFQPHIILPGLAFDLFTANVIGQIVKVPVIYCPLSLQATLVPSKHLETDLGEPCSHFGAGLFGLKMLQWMVYPAMAKACRKKFGPELSGSPIFADRYKHMVEEWVAPASIVLLQNNVNIRQLPMDFPESYMSRVRCTGFWVVSKAMQQEQVSKGDQYWGGDGLEKLSEFIRGSSEPPVYLGWGSMIAVSSEHMAALAVGALEAAGKRGIILGGSAKLSADMLPDGLVAYAKDHVLFTDAAPHEWLFPQCSVTVHHGGMGTTIAALRSCVPTIVTPTIYDQFDNAKMVQESGAGLGLPSFRKVTARSLGQAIRKAVEDEEMRKRAKDLGTLLQSDDGLSNAAKALDDFVTEELDTGKWDAAYETLLRRRSEKPPGDFRWFRRMWSTSPFA